MHGSVARQRPGACRRVCVTASMGETARPRSTVSTLGSASCFQGIAADVDVLPAPRIASAADALSIALGSLEQALLLGRAAQIKKASSRGFCTPNARNRLCI